MCLSFLLSSAECQALEPGTHQRTPKFSNAAEGDGCHADRLAVMWWGAALVAVLWEGHLGRWCLSQDLQLTCRPEQVEVVVGWRGRDKVLYGCQVTGKKGGRASVGMTLGCGLKVSGLQGRKGPRGLPKGAGCGQHWPSLFLLLCTC